MFSKILVGVDGLSGGRDALRLARELSGSESTLVLGHIWESGDGVTAAITGERHPSIAGQQLLEDELLRAGLDGTTAVRSARTTARGLHELADELSCDLLVIGSAAGRELGDAGLGDEARVALHGAPCAVAIAPVGYEVAHGTITSVGVGFKDTRDGELALEQAARLAGALGVPVRVLTVIGPLPGPWSVEPRNYPDELATLMGDHAQALRVRLQSLGGYDVEIERGDPVSYLCEFSTKVGLLVLGAPGYGPVRRMLLGSTSDALVMNAGCAVLVLVRSVLEASYDGPGTSLEHRGVARA